MSYSVVIIGKKSRRGYRDFLLWLCRNSELSVVGQFETIEESFSDGGEVLTSAQLTIVMQSSPDEYSPNQASRLIGQTLFNRLLVCYGPWCESDGRNRSIWPDAHRIPMRLAHRTVEWELLRMARGVTPVPPTSARDEVFAYRMGEPADWTPLTALKELNAAVISPDQVLRKTVMMLLRDLGMRAVSLPLVQPNARTQTQEQQTSRGPVHVVLHDLDPFCPQVEDSIHSSRRMFPSSEIIGIATMPDAGLSSEVEDLDLASVAAKLDLEDGLRWHLQQLVQPAILADSDALDGPHFAIGNGTSKDADSSQLKSTG